MEEELKKIAAESGIDLSKDLPQEQIEFLLNNFGKAVAKSCMQAIVSNVDAGRPSERGWWTIRDNFKIEGNLQSELLPKEMNMT